MQPKGGVNPFSSLVENLCEVQAVPVDPLPRPGRSLRICLVSMPPLVPERDFRFHSYDTKSIPRGVQPDDCKRRLVALNRNVHKRLLDAYKEALLYAVDDFGAQVVCVSELGLPHRAIRPLAEAQNFASQLSKSHNALIVAGTSHDSRTLYNTGYLYHPGGEGWAFHKTLSATGMGEFIASPALRRVLTVKTFGLRIAVMICLDVADYATLASVIRVKEKVDMVLVPCYTQKFDKMLEVAKAASKALRGVVAMVNAHIPNAVCHIARFGEDEEPVRTKKFKSGAVVSLVKIDYENFEQERTGGQKARDYRDVDYLFGNRDLPQVLAQPAVRKHRRRAAPPAARRA